MTSIAVVIINHNTREHLAGCLESVAATMPSEVMVFDNASSDGSAALLRAEFPWVELQASDANLGYGAAANRAVAACRADYVLLLNSDTRLEPDTLSLLSAYLDQHPDVALAGPRLIYPDGTAQTSSFPFPTPLAFLLRETHLAAATRYLPVLRACQPLNSAGAVPWVLGAALALRREAFEAVGGFDESFFMYYEEVDLCYRLQRAGWQIHYAPVTTVTHVGGASTGQRRVEMSVQLFASLAQFYQRHYSPVQQRQLRWIVSYLMLRNLILDTVRLYRAREAQRREQLRGDLGAWRRTLRATWRPAEAS
jgi:N-acetylglucosaminyl-diphospho-decaprenol L-rhamnosyltransferase